MKIEQRLASEYAVGIYSVPIAVGSASTSAPETLGETEYSLTSFTDGYYNHEIVVPLAYDPANVEVMDTGICALNGLVAERLADGYGRVRVPFGSHSVILSLDFSSLGSDTVSRTLTGYTTGTVGAHGMAYLESQLAADKESHYYNGISYAACQAQPGGIQRNPDCWGAAWDLSGVAVSYIGGEFNGGGALVSRRHYLVPHHYNPSNRVGSTLRFVGNTGTVHERTVIAQTEGGDAAGYFNPVYPIGDLCMLLLSAPDLPADVVSYAVSDTWLTGVTKTSASGGFGYYSVDMEFPAITTNQQREVKYFTANTRLTNQSDREPLTTYEIGGVTVTAQPDRTLRFGGAAAYDEFTEYQSDAISGDSGSPVFYPVNDGTLVLLSVLTYPDAGTHITEDIVNGMIAEVDTRAGISTTYTVAVQASPIA